MSVRSGRSRLLFGVLAATILVATTMMVVAAPAHAAITPTSTPSDLASAIAGPSVTPTGSAFETVPGTGTPNGVGDSALAGFPTNGTTFGILTSGDVNLADDPNTLENSGANLGSSARGAFDVSILKVDLTVPSGPNCLRVDFRFLSEEYPEFVSSEFNDGFVAELDPSGPSHWAVSGSTISAPSNFAFDSNGDVISINNSGVVSMTAEQASGTTYDGATPQLVAQTPIDQGAHSVYFSIFDSGDNDYDSAVFLDNLSLGTETVDGCEEGVISDVEADLSITKTMDAALLNTFVLTAHNAGPDTAAAVSISDVLDIQLETAQVCHVTETETCNNFPAGYDNFGGTIDVGTLSNGATEAFKIRVDTDLSLRDGPLSIPNTATIASDEAPDPNTENNTNSLNVIVATVPDPPQINALAPANGRAALNFIQTDDGVGSRDGGSAITEYRVLAETVSPSGSDCPSVLSSPSVALTVGPTPNAADGSFSYFVPSLANFTKYCLAVVGVNAVGSSDQSNVEDVIPTDQADANFVPAAGNLTLTVNPAGASATKTTKTTYTLTGSAGDAGNIVTLAVVSQPGGFCFANIDGGFCLGGKIVHSEPGEGDDIHLEIDQIDTTVSTTRTGALRHVCFTFPCAGSTDPYFVYQDAAPAVLPASCAVDGIYVIGSSFKDGLTAGQALTHGIPCAVPAWSKAMLANRVLKVQELNTKNDPKGNNDIQFQVWIAGDPKRGP